MNRLFVKMKHLPLMSTINPPWVDFILILTAFYNLPISLVMFTHSFINAFKFAPVGLNCTLN